MKNNYCVLVLGMHRSGTSAMSKFILDTGFSLGLEPVPAHAEDNPGGYWESRETLMLNNKFMKECDSNWKDINPIPKHQFNAGIARRYRIAIGELLDSAFDQSNQIVIKDPRMCRLLPLWLPVLKKKCHHLVAVFIVRQAEAVHRSLARRQLSGDIDASAINDWPSTFSLWLRYNLEAEFFSRDVERVVIGFERWLETPDEESRKIFRLLKSALPGAVLQPVEPQLKPSRYTPNVENASFNDIQRLNQQVHAALLNGGRTGFLDDVRAKSGLYIPGAHQDEFLPPPLNVKARLQLKHISGLTPCDGENCSSERLRLLSEERPIVFISDAASSRSHIYRVKNAVDALNNAGEQAWWSGSSNVGATIQSIQNARLVIIHRSEWNEDIDAIFKFCREHNIITAFDIDDLIFEPALVDSGSIYFISQSKPEEKRMWVAKSKAIRKSLMAADFCIASTKAIADQILHHGKQAVCIPNGFCLENLAISDHWRRQSRPNANAYRLGYLSGTSTHTADFAMVAEAVAAFLECHPDWMLTIVGHLDLKPYSGIIDSNRIEHRLFVDHVNLAYEYARLDINLIPLQRTAFCDAKSPLKFFEAALVDVPSIATRNPMYSYLFREGETGLLARSTDDWLTHMNFLEDDATARLKLAMKARNQCLSLFGPEQTAATFKTVLSEYDLG